MDARSVRLMQAEKPTTSRSAIQQAELILKLYELGRETVMREARSFVGGPFAPGSADELVQIVSAGDRKAGYVLQVYGYWDMVAGFVKHGALDAGLVYDTCQEMYFQYAKIQPWLAEFRQKMNLPEWMSNLERLIEGSPEGRARVSTMQKNLATIANARSAQSP